MSLEAFGLYEDPFSAARQPRHPFMSGGYRRALSELWYQVELDRRILIVTATPGVGVSTLLRQFEARVRTRFSTLFLSPECCHLNEALSFLGENGKAADRPQDGSTNTQPPGKLVLFIDDADALDASAVPAMRSMMSAAPACARIVLGGSSETISRLIGDNPRQSFHTISIPPLGPVEVAQYIKHRLWLAGAGGQVFSPDACDAIAALSEGVCARINDLCSWALRTAADRRATIIDASFFPRRSAKPSVAKAPAPRPAERRSGSRASIAISVCALASLVAAGLWYDLAGSVRGPREPDAARRSSHHRIADSSGSNPLGGRRLDAPPAVIEPNTLAQRVGPSSAALAVHVVTPASAPVARKSPHGGADTRAPANAVALSPEPVATSRRVTAAPEAGNVHPGGGLPRTAAPAQPGQEAPKRAAPSDLALRQASFESRLGDAYMRLGEYDNAIRSFRTALGLTPDNAEIERKIEQAHRAKLAEQSTLR